jgi:hypothetical protein
MYAMFQLFITSPMQYNFHTAMSSNLVPCCSASGIDDSPPNILLPFDKQNTEWFQVSKVTLVHFDVVQDYNIQKMCGSHLSIGAFTNQLTTKWGVTSRYKPGLPPPKNTIPTKLISRDCGGKSRGGSRHILSEKVCGDAIIKANIVMIINSHFHGRRLPKYAISSCMLPILYKSCFAIWVLALPLLFSFVTDKSCLSSRFSVFGVHRSIIACRCATRMNFLADSCQLSRLIHEIFELLNMERWLVHVSRCPDPMCGLVIAIEGTCKVVRAICGALLPLSSKPNSSQIKVMFRTSCTRLFSGRKYATICQELPELGSRLIAQTARYAYKLKMTFKPSNSSMCPLMLPSQMTSL